MSGHFPPGTRALLRYGLSARYFLTEALRYGTRCQGIAVTRAFIHEWNESYLPKLQGTHLPNLNGLKAELAQAPQW